MMQRSTIYFITLLLLCAVYNKAIAQVPANDDCAGAISLTVGTPASGDNTDATDDDISGLSTCGSTSSSYTFHHGVWYTVTPSSNGQLTVATCGSDFDTYLRVYEGTCGSFTCVNYNDDGCSPQSTISFAATSGTTYYVFLSGYHDDDYGTYTISATLTLPPANDDCSGAIAFPTIPTDGTCASVTANTAGATQSMSGCAGTADDDVWYSFVCPAGVDSLLFQNTSVSGSADRVIQFFSGDCDNLTSIKCSDPETGGVGGLTAGNTYYFRVYTYSSGNSTEVSVCLKTPPSPPANDDCSGAVALTVNPDLDCENVTSGTTEGATASTETDPDCAASGTNDDVWFSFEATQATQTISLQNVSGSTDMAMAAYSGTCGNLTSLACSDPNTLNVGGLTIGQTYYVRVWTYSSTATTRASFDICVGTPPPPPANDDCSGAIAFPAIPTDGTCASVTANTENATQSMSGCAGTADDDVWYSFVCPAGVDSLLFQNTTVSGNSDRVIQFFSGNCDTLVSLKCSDPESGGVGGLTPGETYYLRVYTYYSNDVTEVSVCLRAVPPPPANDDCSGAVTLTVNPDLNCGNITSGTTESATASNETAPSCGSSGTNDDVWFSFVATQSTQTISLQNVSGSTDMAMAVYSGTCGNLTSLACSDPNTLTVDELTAGATYYVRVWTWSSSATTRASFDICVGTPPPPPINDDCSGAIAFPTIPTDGTCASVTANTVSATQSMSGCAGTADDDVWYSFVCPAGVDSLLFQNTTISGSTDRVIQFFSGDCDNLTSLKCSDPESGGVGGLIAGNTYYLRVYTYGSGNATEVSVCLKVVPPVPSNDACANAIALPCDGTLTGDNTSAADDNIPSVSCGSTTSGARKAVWYTITPTYSGDMTISTCGSAFDTYLRVFEGTCDNFTACAGSNDDDDDCDNNNSTVTFTAVAGTTYYILLGGYSTSSYGSFTITSTCPPPPPIDSVVVSTSGNVPATITTDDGTLQLEATVYPSEADQSVTWSIIPETGSATIDANGLVTAALNGTVWAKAVSVSDNTIADSIEIAISNQIIPVDSVVVHTDGNVPATITTDNGTLQLEATVYPAEADQNVTWSIIPETGDAAIDANGLVTATLNGTVWAKAVSVFDNTMSDSIEITISNQVVPVDSLVVTTAGSVPATITTNAGTLQLVATVYPAEADQNVTWSIIPGTGDATIDANGLVTAVTDGTVWAKAVSVFDNTMADSIEVTISNQIVPVDSVVVTTSSNIAAVITINAGSLQLVATVYPAEADQSVTWSIIPETGDATIDADGLVTATLNGTVWAKAVSVTDTTMADSIEITISNQFALPDSVVVNTDANLPPVITTVGGTLLMNAIVYPIDADQEVSWSIIPGTGNASITSGGLVTAIDDGTVWARAVSVADSSKSDSLLITINQSTGVKQVEDAIGFKLYPNPTNNGLYLVITKPHPEIAVTITDATGREVIRKRYGINELNTPQQIPVSQLPAGAYFLSVNSNGINFSTQFIKQ